MPYKQTTISHIGIIHTPFDAIKDIPTDTKGVKKHNDLRYRNHEIDHVFNKIELVDLHVFYKI